MTKALTGVLRQVRQLMGGRSVAEPTDGELVERFTSWHDESAFAALVKRHGPMVLRTCRRVLNDTHAAEDAFQAAFLVLARKAGSIRSKGSMAGWLYEVARNLALRARANQARRRQLERQAPDMEQLTESPWGAARGPSEDPDTHTALDEELHRLPEKYRTPLVLCYLEGKTNAQAAHELGWPAGSMSSRLEQARELLRDRLNGRGVTLSAGGVALLLAETAAASVPTPLIQTTVKSAMLFAAGKAMAASPAVTLAEGMLNAMITTKLKLVASVLLAVGLLGGGTTALVQFAGAQAPAEKVEAPPRVAPGSDVYGDPLPPGALARMGTLRWRHGGPVFFVGFTNEAKHLVTASQDGFFRVWDVETGREVRKFGKSTGQAGASGVDIAVAGNVGAVMAYPVNMISSVVLSPDGKVLAAGSQDGTVRLHDVETGKEIRNFRGGAQGQVIGLAFAPDGKSVVTKGTDQMIRQWDVASGKELRQIGKQPDPKRRIYFGGGGNTLAFSGDGKQLASAGMELENNRAVGVIQVFEVESGKELRSIKGPQNAYAASLAFAPDGKFLAWATQDGTVRLIDSESGKEIKAIGNQQPGFFINTLLFSPDSKVLATRSTNSTGITLWDVDSGKELRKLGEQPQAGGANVFVRVYNPGGSMSVAFSPDGKTIAEGLSTHSVRLWQVENGKEMLPVSGHQGGVSNLAVTPDGKTLITRGLDNTVRHWNMTSGQETHQVKLPAGAGNAVVSADGQVVAFGGANNAVHIWDAVKGKEIRTISVQGNQQFVGLQGGIGGLALSPDGKVLAAKGYEATIRLYEVATGRELDPVGDTEANGKDGMIVINYGGRTLMNFSPDGKVLATLGASPQMMQANGVIIGGRVNQANMVIRLWSVGSAKLIRQFEVQNRAVAALVFSQDGRTLASLNGDNSLSIWELATGRERCQFKTGQAAPAPTAAEQQRLLIQQQQLAMYGGAVNNGACLSLSSDGRTLATAGTDQIIRLWDIRTGKELGQFQGHQGAILSLAFAPDGKTLVSGSADTTTLVWDGGPIIAKHSVPMVDLNNQQVEAYWNDLGGEDGNKVHKAVNAMGTAPKQTIPYFQEKVQPAAGVEAKKIDQFINDLESNEFTVRQKATEELERLAELAEPALKKVLEGQPSLETRQRVEKLIQRLETNQAPPADVLRGLRAIEVLEQLGTPEARAVLETVAKGAPGAKLTVDAQRALDRLGKK